MAYRDVIVISSDSPSPPPPSPPPPLPQAQPSLLDYLEGNLDVALDVDLDDNNFQFLREESPQMPAVLRSSLGPGAQNEGISKCEEDVLNCFPDICPDYLKAQVVENQWDSQSIITRLLDDLEKDKPYPKRPVSLKRKRPEKVEKDEEEGVRPKFDEDPRLANKGHIYQNRYIKMSKAILKAAFPQRYAEDIESTLKANNYQVYTTYLVLDKASWSPEGEPVKFKKAKAKRGQPEQILRHAVVHQAEIDALAAFDAARAFCTEEAQARESKEAELKQKAREEEETFQRAKAEGAVADCGCCYEELALSSMVHCAGDTTHWFCRSCAKQMAEHVVGLSKYRLGCMSVDGCDATFPRDQKELFLDDKLVNALELIEQEEVLRLAGIENLENCPFCPYAAEYPPVEENKEFRCENPECHLVSCRLCRQETHIPKTCEESAKERGHSARRTIEEAMSAALIRKCNKCGTPFIKENGCNKMTCTRGGCRNVQCYVCSQSCDYNHFDDASRGGKKGNCPLFDSVEDRHRNEVHAAEALARQQVVEQNPEVGEELLTINFSEKVKEDDARRRAAYPAPPVPPRHPNVPGVAVPVFPQVDPANWAPPPNPLDDLQARVDEFHNQAIILQRQVQDRQREFDQRARTMMQAQARAQLLTNHTQLLRAQQARLALVRAQQAHAQQKPVAQLGQPQPFGYPAPCISREAPGFPPDRVQPPARPAPAAPAVVAAPVVGAASAAPAQPNADDRFKPLRSNKSATGRRDAMDGQAGMQPGGIAGKYNPAANGHNNLLADPLIDNPFPDLYEDLFVDPYKDPFAQQAPIQFGSPWAPGAVIHTRRQAVQPGDRPNQQQGGSAHNKTGAQGSQFSERFAAENAGLVFPDIGDFPIPDILGLANPGRQGFAMPQMQDPTFPSTPAGEGRQ